MLPFGAHFSPDQWSALGSMLTGIGTLFLVVAAFIGFKQWRSQLNGTKRDELASRIILLAFRFQDEIHTARIPLTLPHESDGRNKSPSETREEARIDNEYFARKNRLNPIFKTVRELRTASWEGELVFNQDIRPYTSRIEGLLEELDEAIDEHFMNEEDKLRSGVRWLGDGAQSEENQKARRLSKIVYGTKKDDYARKIDEAVNDLKAYLQSFLVQA